ncbi:lantibiotic dehydratase [Paenibacillus sambharensis]|nr:lantibiotic dehydratase [Paenibacillus sambharensis]
MRTLRSPMILIRQTALPASYSYRLGNISYYQGVQELGRAMETVENEKSLVTKLIIEQVKYAESDEDRKLMINLKRDIHNLRRRLVHVIESHHEVWCKYELDKALRQFLRTYCLSVEKEEVLKQQYEDMIITDRTILQDSVYERPDLFDALKFIHPTIMDKLRGYLRTPIQEHTAKLRKLDSTLAKVLTRASHKTSPFSTLTYVGVGYWHEGKQDYEVYDHDNRFTVTRFNQAYILRLFDRLRNMREFKQVMKYRLADTLVLLNEKFYWTVLIDQPEIRKKIYRTTDSLVTVNASALLKSFYETFEDRNEFSMEDFFRFFQDMSYPDDKLESLFDNLYERQFIVTKTHIRQQSECIVEECIATIELLDIQEHNPLINEVLSGLRKIKDHLVMIDRVRGKDQYESYRQIEQLFIELCDNLQLKHMDSKQLLYQDGMTRDRIELSTDRWALILRSLEKFQQFAKMFDISFQLQMIVAQAFHNHFGERRVKVSMQGDEILDVVLQEIISHRDIWQLQLRKHDTSYGIHEVDTLNVLKNKFLDSITKTEIFSQTEIHLDEDTIQDYIDQFPQILRKHEQSNSFFIQKADAHPEQVVLNQFYTGYLVFYLRFISNLPDTLTHPEVEAYIQNAIKKRNMTDIYLSYGFNANIRPPITDRTIQLPNNRNVDETSFQTTHSWEQLEFQYNPLTKKIELFVENERIHVTFLGTLMTRLIPSVAASLHLLSFNAIFTKDIGYAVLEHCIGNDEPFVVKRVPRIVFNRNLILSRERWLIQTEHLREIVKLEGYEMNKCLIQFLLQYGIPLHAFVFPYLSGNDEAAQNDVNAEKPQYVNFSSPILVDLFIRLVKGHPYIVIEEVLPDQSDRSSGHVQEYVFEMTALQA